MRVDIISLIFRKKWWLLCVMLWSWCRRQPNYYTLKIEFCKYSNYTIFGGKIREKRYTLEKLSVRIRHFCAVFTETCDICRTGVAGEGEKYFCAVFPFFAGIRHAPHGVCGGGWKKFGDFTEIFKKPLTSGGRHDIIHGKMKQNSPFSPCRIVCTVS